MKAICSFILALAVSSAGAQIRPVESLPIAVNYSNIEFIIKILGFKSIKVFG